MDITLTKDNTNTYFALSDTADINRAIDAYQRNAQHAETMTDVLTQLKETGKGTYKCPNNTDVSIEHTTKDAYDADGFRENRSIWTIKENKNTMATYHAFDDALDKFEDAIAQQTQIETKDIQVDNENNNELEN